jgi:hypothetical protein
VSKLFNIESEKTHYDFLPEISADDENELEIESRNQAEVVLLDTQEDAFHKL